MTTTYNAYKGKLTKVILKRSTLPCKETKLRMKVLNTFSTLYIHKPAVVGLESFESSIITRNGNQRAELLQRKFQTSRKKNTHSYALENVKSGQNPLFFGNAKGRICTLVGSCKCEVSVN